MKSENSFTLIELVIVIGILAILATVTILVINPSEYLKQARDSTRLSELALINKAIGYYQADGNTSFGTASTVYVSIPDTSSTCDNLGLPTLPDGWSYAYSTSDNYQKTDGNGWIPVNLTSISFGSPLEKLPIDPINTTSTGNYYTYVTGGSWELTSLFESDKYSTHSINDNDSFPGVYSLRTSNTPLTPGIRDKDLVGYWTFDEGTGSTAYDRSGNGNNGTLYNSPTWTTGQVDGALSFDGVDDYVFIDPRIPTNTFTDGWSAFAWINRQDNPIDDLQCIFGRYLFCIQDSSQKIYVYDGIGHYPDATVPYGSWQHAGITCNNSSNVMTYYINGTAYDSDSDADCDFYFNDRVSYIGTRNSGALHDYVYGSIDEARIYDRVLSEAEISAIYDATK